MHRWSGNPESWSRFFRIKFGRCGGCEGSCQRDWFDCFSQCATDYITDGERVETISNGHPAMGKITAMGCSASALTGAFIAVSSEPFTGALNCMAVMGVAGDIAAAKGYCGTGSFQVKFLHAL